MTFKFCPLCGSPMTPFMEDEFPREKCGKCGWIHYHNPRPTVSAIISRDEKILLCRRAAGPFAGKWDLPGGFMEEGESAEAGMRREMREELKVEIEIEKLIGVFGPSYYPFGGQDNYNIDIYYLVIPVGEPVAVDKSDVAEIGWFDPNNLPDMAFPSNVEAIKSWLKTSII
ncbi:NUDIX hydrolase [Candidatus Collierbacteria bacterium]|nr:NUDIX hydrolase [Candidatus Collierbacteria bacterium]